MECIKDIEDLLERDARNEILDKDALSEFSSRGPLERLAVQKISIGHLSTSAEELQLVWGEFNERLQIDKMHYTRENTLDLELATMALQAFAVALRDNKSTRTLVKRLRTAWPRFQQWLSFLADNIGDQSILPERLQRQMFTAIHEFFSSSSGRESLFRVIEASPETIPILAKCWSLEVSNALFCQPVEKSEAYVQFPAACVLQLYLRGPNPRQFEEMKTVLSPVAAAAVALDHVSRVTNDTDLDSVYANVSLLILMDRDEYMDDGVRARSPVREVTRIFYSITVQAPVSVSKRFNSCVTKCRFFLVRSLDKSTNLAWFVDAIDARLLPAILQSLHYETWSLQMILNLLTTTLPKYTIFPSVVDALDKSIAMIETDGLENRVAMLQDHLRDWWISFKNITKTRVAAVRLVDDSLLVKNICSNVECRQLDKEGDFKRCHGCLDNFYCSRTCQREDWVHGSHRNYCKARPGQGGWESTAMTKRNWLIIGRIILSEVRAHQEKLVDYLRAHHFSHIAVDIDYGKLPTSMSLSHTTPHRPEYDSDQRERLWWQRTVEEEHGSRRITIRARIPGMDGVKSWVRISSKRSTKKDEWICNVMPDGKTPISEFLFIQPGRIEVDPVWDMLKDIEC